jgi:hypothetical protein
LGGLVDAEFQAAVGQQGVVLEYLDGRPVGHDPALVQDDGAPAQVHGHIQVMGGDDFGVLEGFEQFDDPPARVGVQAGSSITRMSGDMESTAAMATERFSPPDSL